MSQRIVMDDRMLRYMDPERVQDHWQNAYTGEPSKKLQHSDQLAIGMFNWPRVVVEALTSLIVGQGAPTGPYTIDVMPWDRSDLRAAAQTDIIEEFITRWQNTP